MAKKVVLRSCPPSSANNIDNVCVSFRLFSIIFFFIRTAAVMMCVPIGRNAGVSQTGTWVWGDFVSRNLKGKGLFTSRYWSDMKQTMPTTPAPAPAPAK